MTTGKTIALARRTFVSKVMSLLFNMLSRFVIAIFSKEQASFNFVAAICHCFHFFPVWGKTDVVVWGKTDVVVSPPTSWQ